MFVSTDEPSDIARVRREARESGEEKALLVDGHTVHFDGPADQARDKANTRYLVPEGMELGLGLNTVERGAGLAEVKGFL